MKLEESILFCINQYVSIHISPLKDIWLHPNYVRSRLKRRCSAPSGRSYVQPWTLTWGLLHLHRTLHPHPPQLKRWHWMQKCYFKWSEHLHHIIFHQRLHWSIKQRFSQWEDLLQDGLCLTWQKVPFMMKTFLDGLINVESYTVLSSCAILYVSYRPTTFKTELLCCTDNAYFSCESPDVIQSFQSHWALHTCPLCCLLSTCLLCSMMFSFDPVQKSHFLLREGKYWLNLSLIHLCWKASLHHIKSVNISICYIHHLFLNHFLKLKSSICSKVFSWGPKSSGVCMDASLCLDPKLGPFVLG